MIDPRHVEAGVRVYCGDCRLVMPELPDGDSSVDSVVTDPPYELGFMGKGWDRSGIAYDVTVWRECLRLLKPGGHLLAFGGSRTYHRLACAIEDAGFEIRDQIQWIYGSGFPKSLDVSKAIDAAAGAEREVVGRTNGSGMTKQNVLQGAQQRLVTEWDVTSRVAVTEAAKQWNGWGTALKPAHEPIVLARKPLIGTVAENVLQHGTGGLNIDRCRIATNEAWSYNADRNGSTFHGEQGQRIKQTAEAKGQSTVDSNVLGRWPANVIHDGSDEVLAGFPTTTSNPANGGEYGRMAEGFLKEKSVISDAFYSDTGSAARFFYCAKASQEDRDDGLEEFAMRDERRKVGNVGGDNPRNRGLAPRANHHPTVKPTDLMRYLVRLITPPGGTVLDPFCGSGSTGKAAALEQMNAILIDSEAEYCDLAAARSRLAQGLLAFG